MKKKLIKTLLAIFVIPFTLSACSLFPGAEYFKEHSSSVYEPKEPLFFISDESMMLEIGGTDRLSVQRNYYDNDPMTWSTRDVIWSSENPEIATVDEYGRVKAIARGTTNIVAKADETHTYKCVLRVTDTALSLKDIAMAKGEYELSSNTKEYYRYHPDGNEHYSFIYNATDNRFILEYNETENRSSYTFEARGKIDFQWNYFLNGSFEAREIKRYEDGHVEVIEVSFNNSHIIYDSKMDSIKPELDLYGYCYYRILANTTGKTPNEGDYDYLFNYIKYANYIFWDVASELDYDVVLPTKY